MKTFANFAKKKVTFKTSESLHIIPFNDILFCESNKPYTIIYKTDGTSEMVKLPITEVEKILSGLSFWLTSNIHLVNLKYLDKVPSNNENSIIIDNRYKIPIDDDRKQLLLGELSKWD